MATNGTLEFEESVENDLLSSGEAAALAQRYELFNKIHESRMSQVFLIEDRESGERRILKAIRQQVGQVCDVGALLRLEHPGIERILEVHTTDRYVYVVKEFVPGVTLEAYVDRHGPLPEEEVIRIGLALCDIFAWFHQQKPFPVIYRDLKPANVMLLDNGDIKLIDLDSVRLFKHDTAKDTCFIGTEGYASPEQFGFRQTDSRTDIYTIGTTLYGLLAGHHPEPSRFGLKPVTQIRRDVSTGLGRLIAKCTAFSPEHRYQGVDALRAELERCRRRASASTAHGSIGWIENLLTRFSISPAVVVVLLVSTVLCAVSVGAMASTMRRQAALLSEQASRGNAMAADAQPADASPGGQAGGDAVAEDSPASITLSPIAIADMGSNAERAAANTDATGAKDTGAGGTGAGGTGAGGTGAGVSLSDADAVAAEGSVLLSGSKTLSSERNASFATVSDPLSPSPTSAASPSVSASTPTAGEFTPGDSGTAAASGMAFPSPSSAYPSAVPESTAGSEVGVGSNAQTASIPHVFSYDRTTVLEAFWSGERPQSMDASFLDYFVRQTGLRFDQDMFYLSIAEWNTTTDYAQMQARINAVGGRLILRASGYPDVQVEMSGDSMSSGDGRAQLYCAYVESPETMRTGVAYRIVDETGHWIIPAGMTITRSREPDNSFSFDKTTILEAFWSGSAPTVTDSSFQQFVLSHAAYDPYQFFVAIKEWDPNRTYTQMGERVRAVGGQVTLKADGYADVSAEISDGSMSANNGNGQIYFVYVKSPGSFVPGVSYRLVDTSGHWIIGDGVQVMRPVR